MKIRNTFSSSSALLIGVLFVFSCKKETERDTIQGSIHLEVIAKHHNWNVPGLHVYLAKDAISFPGYDTSAYSQTSITDEGGKVVFNRLFPGDYYLYSFGFDSIWGDSVVGYMPVRLLSSNLNNNTQNVALYVSE